MKINYIRVICVLLQKDSWSLISRKKICGISHASEDKEEIARPLAEALRQAGLRVWYDEFVLRPGDSLSLKIREGQNESKYGLIILSPKYFANVRWAQRELNGFVAREIHAGQVIIPVWHNVTYEDVVRFSPDIADKFAIQTSGGLDVVVQQILKVFHQEELAEDDRQRIERLDEIEKKQAEAIEEYKEIVAPFLVLPEVNPRQRQLLERNRKRLGLSQEVAKRIEDELILEQRQAEAKRVTVVEEPQQKRVQSKPQRQPGEIWEDPLTSMEFVWIPDGRFQMGQTEADKQMLIREIGEKDYNKYCHHELPQHEVHLNGFWTGKYPVTQAQWQQVMGENPAYFNSKQIGKDSRNHPVESVSWDDVQEFLRKLNEQVGTTSEVASTLRGEMDTTSEVTPIFRLPSEAEWEYAARAGTTTIYYFGDDADRLGEYAWYSENSDDVTHPVGQLKPNAWGLYDMLGNVWEWCEDIYASDAYKKHQRDNPIYTSGGSGRMLRGGSWFYYPRNVRCATRNGYTPDDRHGNIGFRLVRTQ